MPFSFKAIIYKKGINLCVDTPLKITDQLKPLKGYIPVTGTINNHPFIQTLVPVKDGPYRLFVNNIMLKGASVKLGDTVKFTIEQDNVRREELFPSALKKALQETGLTAIFNELTPARKKEVLRYLNNLKTKDALDRNIEKVITQLKNKKENVKGFLRAIKPSPVKKKNQ